MNTLEKYFKKFPDFFINRNINNIESINDFITPPKSWIEDPFLFESMDIAVDRILSNPKNNPILIHGDCDADGVSACAVLNKYLTNIGYNIHYYIPNRSSEGHSMSLKAIDFAKSIGSNLIITCDLGMSCFDEIEYANNKGLDVIITDHHKASDLIPNAYSIINPWLDSNKDLPFKEYSGSGVAFKLCHAINIKLSLDLDFLYELMEIAMVGIISDKVPILKENRLITYNGHLMMLKGNNLGLKILNKSIAPKSININKIIKIINMLTKIEDSSIGVKLLSTNNMVQATKYVNSSLKSFYKNNTQFNNSIQNAIRQVHTQEYLDNRFIFIISEFDSAYNGAIANILSIKFKVPTIVISKNKDYYKGSCRSIEGADILSFIESQKELFFSYGGHPMASGFIIHKDKIKELKSELIRFMSNIDFSNSIKDDNYDGVIYFKDIDNDFIKFFDNFLPYGKNNNAPKFISKGVRIVGKPNIFGKNNDSLKFKLVQNNIDFNAIGFGLINKFEKLITKDKFDIEFRISKDINNKVLLDIYDIK